MENTHFFAFYFQLSFDSWIFLESSVSYMIYSLNAYRAPCLLGSPSGRLLCPFLHASRLTDKKDVSSSPHILSVSDPPSARGPLPSLWEVVGRKPGLGTGSGAVTGLALLPGPLVARAQPVWSALFPQWKSTSAEWLTSEGVLHMHKAEHDGSSVRNRRTTAHSLKS